MAKPRDAGGGSGKTIASTLSHEDPPRLFHARPRPVRFFAADFQRAVPKDPKNQPL
jgi:hypothetical protein